MSGRWSGTVCILVGIAMLLWQLQLYLSIGLLSAWLSGGGIGLLCIGVGDWYYLLTDRIAGHRHNSNDEVPTAEEFESRLVDIVPDETIREVPPDRERRTQ